MAKKTQRSGGTFQEALRIGYRAILCSPRFMFFQESPGTTDDFAIANRLSYFLWNSMPDEALLELAKSGELHSSATLKQQVGTNAQDKAGKNLVDDFSDQWLDLVDIDFTQPDRKQFRDFDLIVQNAMLEETRSFLNWMLEGDQGVKHIVDSNITFANSRLARYYNMELKPDNQRENRLIKLSADNPRGGILTQGSIMKVTANGSATSPVIRGVWISERLLGQPIPPPPKNLPTIEPDIRGAKTIREQLEKPSRDR